MMNLQNFHNQIPVRMLQSSMLIIVFFWTVCAFCSQAKALQSAQEHFQSFEQEIERLRKELNIPGLSVAVLQGQKVVFADGYGYVDIENKIPATPNTPYNIASLTKTFAAAIMLKLVEEGRLNLDDEMADILKDAVFPRSSGIIHGYARMCEKINEMSKDKSFLFAKLFQDYHCDTERITLRHHLTHTAQGAPGEVYRYNGFLYGMLSNVAEKVSGKSFAELLIAYITGPLEMTRTVPSPSEKNRDQVLAERAKYYRVSDADNFIPSEWPSKEIADAMKMRGMDHKPSLNAGGGIISTVLDLSKFDMAMDRNLIVSEESKQAMFSPTISNSGQPLPYGLGWFVQEHMDVKLVWHYGWAPSAYSSLILKVPEEEVTLILLANSDGASAPFQLGAGDVLKSPFAVQFLNLFTKLEIRPAIPIIGSVQNVQESDNSTKTDLSVVIGKGFIGKLPDAIDKIAITGPNGDLSVGKDDFRFFHRSREFWIRKPRSPDVGTYTFTVTSGKMSGSATDTQSVIRAIPVPNSSTFSPSQEEILRSITPTFSWGAVKADFPIYYRLEINKLHGGRMYSTHRSKNMESHTVPGGVLIAGQTYRWRIVVSDSDNWIKVENQSHSKWIRFTMAK